ncbi:hypothetical protein VKT23_020650 [Stygiomarasmius scandens]|uniref:Uncharacterized protein n=1 Tax=Marasmiellus scandens TaxID=2682957 RepID=A0ABR1IL83_9AGAR
MIISLLNARSSHTGTVHIHSPGSGSGNRSHSQGISSSNTNESAYRLYPIPASPGVLKQEQSLGARNGKDVDSDQDLPNKISTDADLEPGLRVQATYHSADSYAVGH